MTPELVEALLAAGPDSDPYLAIEDQGALDELEFYLLPTRDLVFTVRALARTPDGGTFLREAVIELGGSRTSPSSCTPGAAARSASGRLTRRAGPPDRPRAGGRRSRRPMPDSAQGLPKRSLTPSSARSGLRLSLDLQPRPGGPAPCSARPWRSCC